MITCGLYFTAQLDTRTVLSILNELPKDLQPGFFSEEDRVTDKSNLTSELRAFESFQDDHPNGFFLIGQKVVIDISNPLDSMSRIYLYQTDNGIEEYFIDVLTAFSFAQPLFAFACESDEYDHRNRMHFKQGSSDIEAWVGRDIGKYVPGVYWLTMFSEFICRKHSIDLRALASNLNSEIVHESHGQILFKLFKDPRSWREHAGRIDRELNSVSGFFNKKDVLAATEHADNTMDLLSALESWR